jgi:pimeloyl-ACP methyl ester carboxylesterase
VMQNVQCPVLLLQADPAAGALMSDAEVAAARRVSPHVTDTRLDGVSHALHATHPALVSDAVATFVRQIGRVGKNEHDR